jgi:hypothetical protein
MHHGEEVGAMGVQGLLSVLPCALILLTFAAMLAMVEVRSGRGYVLAIHSSLHLATTLLIVGCVTLLAQTQPPTNPHTVSITILLVFYFVPAVYAMLVTVIGAAIVAGSARQWCWIVGFVVAVTAPFLASALPYKLPHPL